MWLRGVILSPQALFLPRGETKIKISQIGGCGYLRSASSMRFYIVYVFILKVFYYKDNLCNQKMFSEGGGGQWARRKGGICETFSNKDKFF